MSCLEKASLCAAVVAGLAASASAAVVYDFEDGVNPFTVTTTGPNGGFGAGAGTVVTDRSFAGTNSMYFAPGQSAFFMIPASEMTPAGVEVKMQVFDQGKYINRTVTGYPTNSYGPRWGVATGATAAEGDASGASYGVSIVEKTYYASTNGYVHGSGAGRVDRDWFTVAHHTGSTRQVISLGDGGSNPTGTAYVWPTAGEGKWTEWTFTVTPTATSAYSVRAKYGSITGAAYNISGAASQVFVVGGRSSNAHLGGVWVDNITVSAVPEPALLSLAGLAGLTLLRRRSA